MNTNVDYYGKLGLSPSAEPEVIQAVYRALAKKYHPDIYQGDKAEAERIMRDLNEAIEILSNPQLREEYDAKRQNSHNTTEDFDETIHEAKSSADTYSEVEIEAAFQNGAQFYPEAKLYRQKLEKLSYTLAIAFMAHVVEKREFGDAEFVFKQLRKIFYHKYFGTSEIVLQLAEFLLDERASKISKDNRKKAKKLNQAIKITGSPKTPEKEVSFVRAFMKMNQINELDVFSKGKQHNTSFKRESWHLSQGPINNQTVDYNQSSLNSHGKAKGLSVFTWAVILFVVISFVLIIAD